MERPRHIKLKDSCLDRELSRLSGTNGTDDSGACTTTGGQHPDGSSSNSQLPLGPPEEGWRLMRAFLDIGNPAIRSAVLDMVIALAEQDSQGRSAMLSSSRSLPSLQAAPAAEAGRYAAAGTGSGRFAR